MEKEMEITKKTIKEIKFYSIDKELEHEINMGVIVIILCSIGLMSIRLIHNQDYGKIYLYVMIWIAVYLGVKIFKVLFR